MPKVSVIIPVHNTKEYLITCFDSIINQTFNDIEIIVINDGSEDGSLEIIQEYLKKDKRFILINSIVHQGPGLARNKGIKIARGEFISFVDSDDFIEENMLKSMYAKAIKEDSDVVMCRYQRVEEDLSISTPSRILNEKNHDEFMSSVLALKYPSICWDKLYRRVLFTEHDCFFPDGYYEDIAFCFKTLYWAKKISYTEEIFYNWRKRHGSITRSVDSKHIHDIFKVFDITYNFLREQNCYKQYENEFINRCIGYYVTLFKRLKEFHKFNESESIDQLLTILRDKKDTSVYFSDKNIQLLKIYNEQLYVIYTEYNSSIN